MGLTAEAHLVKGLARVKGAKAERERGREMGAFQREGGGKRDGWSAFVLKRRCREQTESLNKAGSHQNKVI